MCLNPIKIINRTELFNPSASSLYLTVPCGHCEECRKQKRNEYVLRSYYEYEDCILRGGYCYFDTLTYDDEHLPKTLRVPHFRASDINTFFHKLRTYLTRDGYDPKDKLKYLCTSEYGSKTHRPHYHLLFFITIPNLSVDQLWTYIHKSWINGFNDYRHKAPSRVVNGLGALNYVSKYITKDQEFEETISRKISRLKRLGHTISPETLKSLQPKHWQSAGFGISLLNNFDFESYSQTGTIKLPDSKYLFKNIALPMYYKRKLFYTLTKTDGKLKWILNDLGKQLKLQRLDSLISQTSDRYQNIINNLDSLNISEDFNPSQAKQLIFQYLGNRSLSDFAKYCVVYKGHLFNSKSNLLDYRAFYYESLKPGKTISNCYSPDLSLRSSSRARLDGKSIKQSTLPEFKDFDFLYTLFSILQKPLSSGIQSNADRITKIQSRLLPLIKQLRQ